MNRISTPTKYEKQSRERINEIIAEFCDGSQQQLSTRTGINKASISQYVNGRNVPSNLTAKKMAEPFNINPAWIMGFDVPKYNCVKTSSSSPTAPDLTEDERKHLEEYRKLNEEGQKKIDDLVNDLNATGNYLASFPDKEIDKKAYDRAVPSHNDITPEKAGIIKKSENAG